MTTEPTHQITERIAEVIVALVERSAKNAVHEEIEPAIVKAVSDHMTGVSSWIISRLKEVAAQQIGELRADLTSRIEKLVNEAVSKQMTGVSSWTVSQLKELTAKQKAMENLRDSVIVDLRNDMLSEVEARVEAAIEEYTGPKPPATPPQAEGPTKRRDVNGSRYRGPPGSSLGGVVFKCIRESTPGDGWIRARTISKIIGYGTHRTKSVTAILSILYKLGLVTRRRQKGSGKFEYRTSKTPGPTSQEVESALKMGRKSGLFK